MLNDFGAHRRLHEQIVKCIGNDFARPPGYDNAT